MEKYELWWFADNFGYTPDQTRALSYSDRQALKAVAQGRQKALENNKPEKPKRVVMRRGRRPRRRRR